MNAAAYRNEQSCNTQGVMGKIILIDEGTAQ